MRAPRRSSGWRGGTVSSAVPRRDGSQGPVGELGRRPHRVSRAGNEEVEAAWFERDMVTMRRACALAPRSRLRGRTATASTTKTTDGVFPVELSGGENPATKNSSFGGRRRGRLRWQRDRACRRVGRGVRRGLRSGRHHVHGGHCDLGRGHRGRGRRGRGRRGRVRQPGQPSRKDDRARR